MNLNIVRKTDFFTDIEFADIVESVRDYVPLVVKGHDLGAVTVSVGLTDTTSWNINLTDDKKHFKAYGYHTVEVGVPAAYISPYMNRLLAKFSARRVQNIYGVVAEHPEVTHTHPAIFENGKIKVPAWTEVMRPARPTDYTPGFISVVLHEVAEILVDPLINRWAFIPPSLTFPNGGQVLIEVGDHVNSTHFFTLINGKKIVMPDFTNLSFYDPKGLAPFSYCNAPTAPLTFPKGTYAYIRDGVSKARMMQFAEIGDDRL